VVTFAGYLMNLGILPVLVDRFGVAHQIAQLVALAAIIPTMFMLLRHGVFKGV
jgi:putative flippase GtrA